MNKYVEEHAVVSQILSYLSCDTVVFMDRIKFASDILTYRVINEGEQWCHYNLVQWNHKVSFDIFNYINDHVTIIQL